MRAIVAARLAAEARSLPLRNPAYPSDALLAFADMLAEAARELAGAGQTDAACVLRAIEDTARTLAPIFAPPLDAEAATHILRRETT